MEIADFRSCAFVAQRRCMQQNRRDRAGGLFPSKIDGLPARVSRIEPCQGRLHKFLGRYMPARLGDLRRDFGRGDGVPDPLAEARVLARRRRLAENRARQCAMCA